MTTAMLTALILLAVEIALLKLYLRARASKLRDCT